MSEKPQSLITGGSSGIGLEVAKRLIKSGDIVHSFDVQPPLQRMRGLEHHNVNVVDWIDVSSRMARISGQFHRLLNNAGILVRGDVMDVTSEGLEDMWRVNFLGSWNTIDVALDQNKLAQGATIAQMCSVGGLSMYPGIGAYCMTKHGVHEFIRSLPRNLAKRDRPDVIVKGIYPGAVDTPMTRAGLPSRAAYRRQAKENWGHVHSPVTVAQKIMQLFRSDAHTYRWDMDKQVHVFE